MITAGARANGEEGGSAAGGPVGYHGDSHTHKAGRGTLPCGWCLRHDSASRAGRRAQGPGSCSKSCHVVVVRWPCASRNHGNGRGGSGHGPLGMCDAKAWSQNPAVGLPRDRWMHAAVERRPRSEPLDMGNFAWKQPGPFVWQVWVDKPAKHQSVCTEGITLFAPAKIHQHDEEANGREGRGERLTSLGGFGKCHVRGSSHLAGRVLLPRRWDTSRRNLSCGSGSLGRSSEMALTGCGRGSLSWDVPRTNQALVPLGERSRTNNVAHMDILKSLRALGSVGIDI